MRALFVLLVLAALARAEDELYQTVWIVGQDGELLGWPDPQASDAATSGGNLKPFRVFESGPDACLSPLCCWGLGLLLVPGPSDLASLCDPERHLRKTNQNVFDEWLLMSVEPDALAQDRTDPKTRRVFLDVLLGWRVIGDRRLKEAVPMLRGIAETEVLDPITRCAAADIAADLEGRKPRMPDLPALDGVPADADVIAIVDQRRVPPWRDIWGAHNVWAIREARRVLARVGAAVTPMDLCFAQWQLDRHCEAFYELARRFGNARVHRTVLALMLPPDPDDLSGAKILVRCEGLFETDCFEAGCAAGGIKHVRSEKGVVSAQALDVDVVVEPKQLLVSRNYVVPPAGGGIPPDLATLGLGGDDAIWIHCRRVPFADKLPVTGVETLTLRASFEGGVTLRCRAGFKDAESAKAGAAEIESWKGLNLAPAGIFATPFRDVDRARIERVRAFLESLKVSVEGTTVTAECTAKGETPESLLEGVVDLEAIYTPFGND